jgi:hypothetical protein
MLRVEIQQLDGALICRLEGRFTGAGAQQVRTLVTECQSEMRLIVDLTEVMYIDSVGEGVLSLLKRLGSQFVAETSYSKHVCERLNLPLAGNDKPNAPASGDSNGKGTDGNGSD